MKILLAALSLVFAGCRGAGTPQPYTNAVDPNFKLILLFEVDGCKVFRFQDWETVYFTTCQGQTSWTRCQSNGKNSQKCDEKSVGTEFK